MTLASSRNIMCGYVNGVIYLYRSSTTSAMSDMEGLENGYLQLLRNVSHLRGCSVLDFLFLRLKVARTLFLCWRTKGNLKKAFSAATKSLYYGA